MKRAEAVLAAVLVLLGGRTRADWLNVSGLAADYSPGGHGKGGGVEWGHDFNPSALAHVGAFAFHAAGARWRFGRLGGIWKVSPSTRLQGRADVGRGRFADQAGFRYQIFAASLSRVLHKTLEASVEDQYILVGRARGHVLKVGASLTPRADLMASLSFHRSLGGSVQARYVSGRADWLRPGFRLTAGFADGRGRSDIRGLYEVAATASDEIFAGLGVPQGGREFSFILSRLRVGDSRSYSLQLNYRVPLN